MFKQDAAGTINQRIPSKARWKVPPQVFVKVLDISESYYALAVALEDARPSNVDKFYRVLKFAGVDILYYSLQWIVCHINFAEYIIVY